MADCKDIATIGELLKTVRCHALTVFPEQTVGVAAGVIDRNKKGMAVVRDADRKMLGVVSVMDVNRAVANHGEQAPGLPVREIMNSAVVSCAPRDSVRDALDKMRIYHIRHLPVVEDGVLRGLVTMRDLLRCGCDDPDSVNQEIVERFQDYFPRADYH